MKKPGNRKERIEFLVLKYGKMIESFFAYHTDVQVKAYFESVWPKIKDMPDCGDDGPEVTCIRCNSPVIIEHHYF
jgi:hypothetical protein